MKTLKKILSAAAAFAAVSLIFCSCGGADMKYAGAQAVDVNNEMAAEASDEAFGWDSGDVFYDMELEADLAEPSVASPAEKPSGNAGAPESSGRKIIKTGSMTVETLEFDRFLAQLETNVSAFGGYIEYSSTYGSQKYRSASYTVRVPSERYDEFSAAVENLGTVTYSSTSVDDKTLTYIDIEARLSALTAERDSFMELMSRAETVEEILSIRQYLTDVNYQIESYTSQLNSLKDKISYSTLSIEINEVERVTPEEPKTVWERISVGFSESVYNLTEGFKDLFVGFVSATPYLAIYAFAVAFVVIVIVLILRASKKRQEKKLVELRRRENGENNR